MTAQVLEATPALDAHGNVTWTLCNKVANQCGGSGQYPAVSLPATSGATPFTITITDTNHLGVTFANNSSDPYAAQDANGAIWIQPGNNCPQQPTWNTGNVIPSANRVTDTKITFNDGNGQNGAQMLKYQLNFVRNGSAVTPLDPIINNGGCCAVVEHNNYDYVWYAAGAVAVIVILVLAIRMMQRRT